MALSFVQTQAPPASGEPPNSLNKSTTASSVQTVLVPLVPALGPAATIISFLFRVQPLASKICTSYVPEDATFVTTLLPPSVAITTSTKAVGPLTYLIV